MEGVVLKHSPAPSEELYLTTKPRESAAASRRSSHGLDLKDLDKLTRNIGKFNPSVPNSQNVQAYLQDIYFHLEMRPNVMDKDKLYLLWTTSSPEVRSFLDRQPANTKTDYQLLQKALIKEFTNPDSVQGLVAALEMRQGRHEPPQAYYSQLRRAYFGTRNEPDMEDELNFKTLFLRNLHPGISHHFGVLACPRTMNTQQLRDLVQKAYGKQGSLRKECQNPSSSWLQHSKSWTGSRGHPMPRQRQYSTKPPHREWNAPPSSKERDSHAGTRPKQRYDRWDGPRGRQHSPGRHWDKSWEGWPSKASWESKGEIVDPAKLIWKLKREKLMGIQWKLQGKTTNSPWSNQPKESTKEFTKIPGWPSSNWTKEQKTPPYFDSQKLMEMMMKEFFQQKEEDRKWEKKEKPDSAWQAVGQEGSDTLTQSATENSTASPHSQRTVNTLTSDGHETPPENPATELNANSTTNTPDHSSVQQTPADETPQVPESAVLVVCHSSEEHQISSDILNVSSQTPVPQLLGDLI